MRVRKIPLAAAAAVALLAAAGLVALAETVYVKARSSRMLDKPDAYEGKMVKRLFYRERLERLERGKRWDKVKSGETVGYVRTRDLVTRKPKDTTGRARGWAAMRSSSDPAFTAGTRALGPLGKKYTAEHNLEAGRKVVEEVMDKMEIDLDELDKFQREGRLGDYAGGEGSK